MLAKQERLLELSKEILREDFLNLEILRYQLREDFESGESGISGEIRDRRSGHVITVEGKGVGGIDAFFHALKAHYAKEHLSLDTITVHDFRVQAKMDTRRHADGADAQAEVVLEIRNSYGRLFRFSHTSRSVIQSGICATLRAVEYFVNSERTVIRLHEAIEHARAEGRADTVATCMAQMADLVENTSYTDVVDRIRRAWRG